MGKQIRPQSKKNIQQVTLRHISADLFFYPEHRISSSYEKFGIYISTFKNTDLGQPALT